MQTAEIYVGTLQDADVRRYPTTRRGRTLGNVRSAAQIFRGAFPTRVRFCPTASFVTDIYRACGGRSHSRLQVTKVNTYALVFHWQGSDESLKPVILTGHQGESLSGLEDKQDGCLLVQMSYPCFPIPSTTGPNRLSLDTTTVSSSVASAFTGADRAKEHGSGVVAAVTTSRARLLRCVFLLVGIAISVDAPS
jgi:hypothetical protein